MAIGPAGSLAGLREAMSEWVPLANAATHVARTQEGYPSPSADN